MRMEHDGFKSAASELSGMVVDWASDQVVTLVDAFTGVATADPLSFAMLAIGALLVAFASAVVGVLALGAAVDAVSPTRPGRTHPGRG